MRPASVIEKRALGNIVAVARAKSQDHRNTPSFIYAFVTPSLAIINFCPCTTSPPMSITSLSSVSFFSHQLCYFSLTHPYSASLVFRCSCLRERMPLIQDNAVSTEEEALTLMLQEILTDSENDVGQSCFKEETIEKLMQELYKEITVSAPSPESPSPTPTLSSNVSLVGQEDQQDELLEFEVPQKTEEEEFKDFDDEWLARMLSWSQVFDTTDWF